MSKIDFNNCTPYDIIKKYPNIISHMIEESLGYFTPVSAAIAFAKAMSSEPYYCEWYTHCAGGYDKDRVTKVTREKFDFAISSRKYHYKSSTYKKAKHVVKEAINGYDPVFASWF